MFITTDVSSSKNYTEAVARFKTEISRQCKDFTNESLRLLPSKLPNKIHSGQAAWLLALSLLYKNHAEIPVDTKHIENEAKSIHMLLETFIANNFPDALLNKDFACDFDRSIHYGFMITKSSFIKFIKKTASLCSCLASKQSKQKTLDRQQSDQIEGVSMYPHIRDLNILIRADQVMAVYSQVCLDNPFKINLMKINEPIDLINLAWVLAICSLNTLNFKDLALIALEKSMYNKLMTMVNNCEYEVKNKLKHKYVDEVDPLNITVTKRHSYVLPSEVVIFLLSTDPSFIKLCTDTQANNACEKLNSVKEEASDNVVFDEQESKSKSKTDYDEDRPSDKTIAKCEFIVKELEEIAVSIGMAINREILWQQLRQKCKDNVRFKLVGKYGTSIIEIATENQWNREGLKHHMDHVIEWHKHHYSQLYS